MNGTTQRIIRLLKAAIVLATVYALGVGALLALFAFLADLDVFVEELAYGLLPFAILLGVAFVVLALARRIGFVLLWIVLVGLWGWMLLAPSFGDLLTFYYSGLRNPFMFALWSVVAVPLFVITTIGAKQAARTKAGPWALPPLYIVGILWLLLVAAGFILRDQGHPHFAWVSMSGATISAALGWLLWAPMPAVIAAVALRTFWVRTRPGRIVEAAA